MVKNNGRHYIKHIITGFFSVDRLLLWDSTVRESALRCLCPTSLVEFRCECGWWLVSELVLLVHKACVLLQNVYKQH
jgi:hypothetical protein